VCVGPDILFRYKGTIMDITNRVQIIVLGVSLVIGSVTAASQRLAAQDNQQQPQPQSQEPQPQAAQPQATETPAVQPEGPQPERAQPQKPQREKRRIELAQAAAQAQQRFEQAQQNTPGTLQQSSTLQKYIFLQQVRQNGRDALGVSPTSAGPLLAADIVSANAADQLYQPFGAVFDLLGSFSDAGSGAYPSAQSGIQTEALGQIEWESEHYGYKNTVSNGTTIGFEKKFDFSFGGGIGIYPALVLENLSSTTTTIAQPLARPMFQAAFKWEIGPRLNRPLFSHGEASAFANFGQNFLLDQVTSFKQGDNTVTATPVSNGVGRAAAFAEGGLEAKILSSTIWLAHDNKYDNLRPLFLVATGVRKDTRLSGSGDLGGYDHPQERLFFRFFINLTSITAYSDDVKKSAPGSIRFGIDMDRGLLSQRVPTATRFFVSADFNIMQVFKPSTQKQ
jgi:hypothetical protein